MRTLFGTERRILLVFALLMASARISAAQSTATLQGTVTDTQGAVMPGVSIIARNTATGVERSVVTSSAGEYVAAALRPGHYEVVAHLEGFQDQKREVDLGVAQTIVVNLRLGVLKGKWDTALFVNNLTDKRALLALDRERGLRARISYLTNQPRTIGISTRVNF